MVEGLAGNALCALIVGGGSGTRFGGLQPKQFLPLAGKPILAHTLRRFLEFDPALKLGIVLPTDYLSYWRREQPNYVSSEEQARIKLIPGGPTRTQSVYNGLLALGKPTAADLIIIQDAVRPFVNRVMINDAYRSAAQHGSGVCAVPSKSSLRLLTENGSVAVDRSLYQAVQTPQAFNFAMLLEAYHSLHTQEFTDDASLVEAAGHAIHLVMGAYDNIKITTPEDLLLAEILLPDFARRWS